jgi:hypothetical protein
VFLSGCGYVGEPLPPLLHIPARVTDLRAVQRGSKIILLFAEPQLTTEGTKIVKPPRMEVRLGVAPNPFQADAWESGALVVAGRETEAAPWAGKDIVIGVRVTGANGRTAGWSNLFAMPVVPPLERPTQVTAVETAEGLRLSWTSAAARHRVVRRLGDSETAAEVDGSAWTDTSAEFGRQYEYRVLAVMGTAESDPSEVLSVVYRDRIPPAVPVGLTAAAGAGSIELVWEAVADATLAGYRIYRAAGDAELVRVGESPTPGFSDRSTQPGQRYRYAVTAIDQAGNESPRSSPAAVTAP